MSITNNILLTVLPGRMTILKINRYLLNKSILAHHFVVDLYPCVRGLYMYSIACRVCKTFQYICVYIQEYLIGGRLPLIF